MASIVLTILGIAGAMYFRFLVDDILFSESRLTLHVISLGVVLITLMQVLLDAVRQHMLLSFSMKVDAVITLISDFCSENQELVGAAPGIRMDNVIYMYTMADSYCTHAGVGELRSPAIASRPERSSPVLDRLRRPAHASAEERKVRFSAVGRSQIELSE
ncbi:hypothetical protein [Spirochaeta dissipatitropha]